MIFEYAIIDADPLVYRCGFAVEKKDKSTGEIICEPFKNAAYNINSMIRKIYKRTGCKKHISYLTATGDMTNFRFEIYPQYKENRKNARRPIYYNKLREFIMKRWGAKIISGQEADDACSIVHCALLKSTFIDEHNTKSIVCSFDKDFNNIPGWHYNYVKDDIYFISELQSLKNFYLQILTGDTSDGIPRIKKGWRQLKTEEMIMNALTEEELLDIVIRTVREILYSSNYVDVEEIYKYVENRGRLVWLRREVGELWTLPLTKV